MKIRWSRGSVRMRITPSELAALERGEALSEELTLPGGSWIASIRTAEASALTMQGNVLEVHLTAEDVAQLAAPENEGVYFDADGTTPRYYIEKDFPCAHPRAAEALEPQSETFAPTREFIERSKNEC